ncbi:MAG: alpha-L-fucosidase [Alistipes sp.]|jgi:alpha-L-fucosidase|nr:alpha-L-fucosidase [Alistipes sp.]
MKKLTLLLLAALTLAGATPTQAQAQAQAQQQIPGADTQWFEEARFGMFVHFGPYAVLGAGEWVMNSRPIARADYLNLQNVFNPQSFDAAEWVRIAKEAGMRYIILTSRHHDGFSNWATAQSEWNIMNTPYGRDIIRQLADECRAQGMKLGFYYSLLDWTRDDYQWRTGRTGQNSGRTAPSDWRGYVDFMKAQLTELLTQYGDIAMIWFDGHWDQTADANRTDQSAAVDWMYPEIYGHIRSLQPDCLIANNHHLPPFAGEDYQIFERDVPGENTAGYSGQAVSRLPLETCQTINGSWGWNITDRRYKSSTELIHLLVRTAGVGGNLLLNVGPMPDGRITPESTERLGAMGDWLRRYGHTIYGTKAGFVRPQRWGAVTTAASVSASDSKSGGDKLYIHILDGSEGAVALNISGFRSARWLNVEGPLPVSHDRRTGWVTFVTADSALDPVDSIIEVSVN